MTSFRHYAALHAGALAVGLALAALGTSPGSIRLGAEIGAGVSALTALPMILFGTRALTGSLQAALRAVIGSFLMRVVAVAIALVGAHLAGGDLLAAAGGFFALYLVGQILELTYVAGHLKAARIGAPSA